MSSPPALSRSEVRNWTEQRFYDRGDNYFQQGRILRPRREGRTLKAECQGSQPSPYHVEAELDEGGIAAAECSCPMGGGGYCKHVVALLLTWVESPDKFESQAPLEATLREQSPDTLVRMILTMVDRHPDLERLARHSAAAGDTLDPEKLRRQIQSVFKDMGHGHDNHDRDPHSVVQQVADDLQPFFNRAEKYREHGRFHDAATGYRLLVEETIDHHENFYDEEGELTSRVAEATRELGEILGEVEDDPDLRETILRTLFQTYAWDVDLGGHGVGDWAHDAILEHATRDERQRVAEWVRDRIPNTAESLGRDRSVLVIGKDSGSSWHNDWKRETLGGFLLDLLADSLDDEEYLQICRQTGRMTELIERLLERDRLDEALDAAHEASDYEVYQLTAPFAEHGAEDALYDLVLNRLDDETDRRLVAWLRDAAVDRNDPDRALALSRRLFWTETSESAYERL